MISPEKLEQYESDAVEGIDSLENQRIGELINEIHRLRHELADPRYQYCGSRIHRFAVLCRNGQIDRLQKEVRDLKEQVESFSKPEASDEASPRSR